MGNKTNVAMKVAEIYEKDSEEKDGTNEQVNNDMMAGAEAKEIISVEESSSATADASHDIQTDQQQAEGSQLDDLIVPNSLIVEKEGQPNKNETVAEEIGSQKALIIVKGIIDDDKQAETKGVSYSFPTHHHVVALLGAFLCLLVANQVKCFL